MRRRDFITGGAALLALATPVAAQSSLPRVGFLHFGAEAQNARRLAAFRQGLSTQGFREGENVTILYRWAEGRESALQALATDLLRQDLAVVFADTRTIAAVKALNASVPVVFAVGGDPVSLGLVQSFNRPGGRITGATSANAELAAKRLGVLRELVPAAEHYYAMVNSQSSLEAATRSELRAAGQALGIEIRFLSAATEREIEDALGRIPDRPGTVLVFPPDAFYYSHRARLVELVARRRIPAIYDVRDYVDAGGLVSYGTDFADVMRLAGVYVGRVLKGEAPETLPVQRTEQFQLVINAGTARQLGLDIPARLLSTADDVVE